MKSFISLRIKLIITVLPLVMMIIFLNSYFGILESRSALSRLASKHLSYKAEQLRDFAFSEWTTLQSLGLDQNPDYLEAMKQSIYSYAHSLLRNQSESIFLIDLNKSDFTRISLGAREYNQPLPDSLQQIRGDNGWIEFQLEDDYVGIVFPFPPLNYSFVYSDLFSTFFSDIRDMEKNNLIIIAIAMITILVLAPLSVGHIIRHIEELTAVIKNITRKMDFTKKVPVSHNDETGHLAEEFNKMLVSLNESYSALELKNIEAQAARETAENQEREALLMLGEISDIRDENTGAHLTRIGRLSGLFGKLLNFSKEELDILVNSSPLHDIGKIGVPDSILLKPGKLTVEEFEIVKEHTIKGYNLLKNSHSRYLREGAEIALCHHEWWDGSGYPRGLSGEAIPLNSRIVSIVDVFDALISERPYKHAFSPEKTHGIILEKKGSHFDPILVDLFDRNIELFLNI